MRTNFFVFRWFDAIPVPGFHHLRAEDVSEERGQVLGCLGLREGHGSRDHRNRGWTISASRPGSLYGNMSRGRQVQVRCKSPLRARGQITVQVMWDDLKRDDSLFSTEVKSTHKWISWQDLKIYPLVIVSSIWTTLKWWKVKTVFEVIKIATDNALPI